jgi:hypothetical protein
VGVSDVMPFGEGIRFDGSAASHTAKFPATKVKLA